MSFKQGLKGKITNRLWSEFHNSVFNCQWLFYKQKQPALKHFLNYILMKCVILDSTFFIYITISAFPLVCLAYDVRHILQFLINLQLWPLIFLQPLNLQGCTIPHLKDLIDIYLENESQGHSMTFNMVYLCSKYPYFISYRGLC